MTIYEATVEAADIEWLTTLLGQLEDEVDRDEVGCDGIDIAASHGYDGVIKSIYRWWVVGGYEPTTLCRRALYNAVAGGHSTTVRVLLSQWYIREIFEGEFEGDDPDEIFDFDVVEALELAVSNKDDAVIWVLCEESNEPGKLFEWAAEHDNFQVFDGLFHFHYLGDMDGLYEAMLIAVSRGCLDIVKLVIDRCGADLLDYADGTDLFACPLDTAIQHGKREIIDYLHAHEWGHKSETYESALFTAAAYGPMEVFMLIYNKETFETSAPGGHLRARLAGINWSRRDFDLAFEKAAFFGQMEAAKYLSDIEGYKPSSFSLDEAFSVAAIGCHLEMLQFLDGKRDFSREVISVAFIRSIADAGGLSETRINQARVLKFLFSKGGVYPRVLSDAFPEAAKSSDIEVIKLLYSMGWISPKSMERAFGNAAEHNCAEVVEFLFKTGCVRHETGEAVFLEAVGRNDLYTMECLINCGILTQNSLTKALEKHRSNTTISSRVLLFLKRKQKTLTD